jgi:uncharacterized protein
VTIVIAVGHHRGQVHPETPMTALATTSTEPTAHRHLGRLRRVAGQERTLLQLSVAAIAVHVIDDNFLQPEPGTSAADHLVSGLVPLGLVLAAAAVVLAPRVRAGTRAALELLLAGFGLILGTEAVYYTSAGRMSGDDYTGALALVAALTLLVAGSARLWRSRRRDGGRPWRYTRRLLLTSATAAYLVVVHVPVGMSYVFTHAARAAVPAASLGVTPQDVSFRTSDGLRLRGWFVPSTNGATVIAFPGRSRSQQHARLLIRHGYGVLLFDRRGEGVSDGDPNMFGWSGERDLLGAAAYLKGRADVDPDRIGAIGLSVGGEMLIHAAAHSHAFRAIVTEGASQQSLNDVLANDDIGWLDAFLGAGAVTAGTSLFANQLPPTPLKREVAKISPAAVFFIYGEHGQGGSETKPNKGFYAAAGQPKQIWEVPDGQHIAGITTRPVEYEKRVIAFYDRYLLAPRS